MKRAIEMMRTEKKVQGQSAGECNGGRSLVHENECKSDMDETTDTGQSGATHGGMWLTPPGRKHEQPAEEEDDEEHTARRTAEEKRELMYEHEDTSPSDVH